MLLRSVDGGRKLAGLAPLATKLVSCASRTFDGGASLWTLRADKNLAETPLAGVANASLVAAWRDAAVALDVNGKLSFHRGGADPAYPPVTVGNDGAAALYCGDATVLVAHADRLDCWALGVDEHYGTVAVAPLARLALGAPPRCLCPADDGALGLVTTTAGALWYPTERKSCPSVPAALRGFSRGRRPQVLQHQRRTRRRVHGRRRLSFFLPKPPPSLSAGRPGFSKVVAMSTGPPVSILRLVCQFKRPSDLTTFSRSSRPGRAIFPA